MLLKVYSIYDSKAEAYNQPFYMQSTGAAIRAFEDNARDPSTSIHKHPEDYSLFELGTFDDATASFDTYLTPKSLGVAIEFMNENDVSSGTMKRPEAVAS